MRLIDADKLLRDIERYHLSDGKFQHWVEAQQTIEPERKKGKWVEEDYDLVICSECGEEYGWIVYRANFCENCGADMRGANDE